MILTITFSYKFCIAFNNKQIEAPTDIRCCGKVKTSQTGPNFYLLRPTHLTLLLKVLSLYIFVIMLKQTFLPLQKIRGSESHLKVKVALNPTSRIVLKMAFLL